MTDKSYKLDDEKIWVQKIISTEVQEAVDKKYAPFRKICVTTSNPELDVQSSVKVIIEVVNGLQVNRGFEPANAAVIDYDGVVTISIDGQNTTKTLSNGTVTFDLTTDKPAGSTITVKAESLTDHPAESDSVEIEVVSP